MFVFRGGLVALLVICTEAACPTVEPAPGTSPTAGYITGPSGAVSDRKCTVTLAKGFNIAVSPGPLNTDVQYGYRYFYGTEVNITCSSKTTDQDLIFLYPCSASEDLKLWSDPSPSVTTLTLNSSSPVGNYWLGCWVANCTCGASPDPSTFDATNMAMECIYGPDDSTLISLSVGHPAPQPTNFWCMSDWWTLTCGWTLGSRTVQTFWSVSYWPPTHGSLIPCWKGKESIKTVTEGQEVNVTCTVDQYFLRYQTFVFQVIGNNVYGNIRENFTTRTDRSIVKLLPIKGLTVVTVPGNATMLDVSWELPDRTQDMECEWRVRVLATGDAWRAMDRLVGAFETQYESSHILLDGLHAFVNYTIQIQIRLNGSQHWSDETEVQATTPEDKPSQSPELTPGGYINWDCRQEKCLSLYWKYVPAAAQNGKITCYQVVIKDNLTIVVNITKKMSGNSLTVNIEKRDDVTLVVELSAGTSAGFSSSPSRIDIPPRLATPVLRDREEVNVESQQISVDAANARYTMTWSTFSGNDKDDYITVFWCKGRVFDLDVSFVECLAEIEWTHLAPNITAHTLDLTDDLCGKWYFGVSRTRGNVSRGVTWNRCVYDYMGGLSVLVPSKPTIQASSKSETELTVSWDFNMCDVRFLKGLPVTYEIFYRKTDSANPSCLGESARNVTAEVDVNSVVLPNLIPGATYGVCMRILTARNASDVSDVKVATPSVASTDGSNVAVFDGVLVAIFAVVMVTCILVLRWRLQLKAKKFPSGDSWLPKPKIPVERSLVTRSSPSRTIQVSRDADIQDRPVTQTRGRRQVSVLGADGESDNTEDTVHDSSSLSEAKGQKLEHVLSSGPSGAVAGDMFAAMCEAGISNTMEFHLLGVQSELSLHGEYISESALCTSCDVRINNIPCSRHVPELLPSSSCEVSINDAVEGSIEVSTRSQNSPEILDCSPDRDDERAVGSDSARDFRNPRSDVERSGYVVFDKTVADKRTHSPYNTTTPGADAGTPFVKKESKFSSKGFTNKRQHHSIRNAQDSTFRLTGYLPHHELSDKMSLASTTGMLTINEGPPWLGRTFGDGLWEDGHAGNADINISVQEREKEDKQPKQLMAISPANGRYVLMEAEHRERSSTALTKEIRVDDLLNDNTGQPDNNLYLQTLAELSTGLPGELYPPNRSDKMLRAAESWRKMPPDNDRTDDKEKSSHVTPYITWEEAEIMSSRL